MEDFYDLAVLNKVNNLENKTLYNSHPKYETSICVNTWIDSYNNLVRDIQLWKNIGVSTFRFPCIWGQVEVALGVYDFTHVIKMVKLFHDNGIKSDIIINATNSLYGTDAGYPTTTPQLTAYTNMAKALVQVMVQNGYTGQIYEVINEANLKGSTAIDYTNICKQLYPEIKTIDNQAKIYTHSTAYIPFDWIKTTFDNGILDYTDGISVHAYTNVDPEVYNKTYLSLQNLIKEYTIKNIPIIQGESGYSTVTNWNGTGINTIATDDNRGIYLARLLLNGLTFGFKLNNLHASYSNELDNTNVEDWFGIIHPNGTVTSTYNTLKSLFDQLKNLAYVGIYFKSESVTVLQFVNSNGIMSYIGWTTKTLGEKITISNKHITLSNTPNMLDIVDNTPSKESMLYQIESNPMYKSIKINNKFTLRRYGKMVELQVSALGANTVAGWTEILIDTIPYGYIPINTYFFKLATQTVSSVDPLYLYVTNDGNIKLFNQGSDSKTFSNTVQTVYHWFTANPFPA